MKKIIFNILFSFFFSLCLNVVDIWLYFTPFYFMMEGRKISENAMWEIPMGSLICKIALSFSNGYEGVVLRSLIILSAAVISATNPKKLLIFFPAAALSLLLSAESGAAVISACLWCGASHFLLLRRKLL